MENGINLTKVIKSIEKSEAPYLFSDKVMQKIEDKRERKAIMYQIITGVSSPSILITILILCDLIIDTKNTLLFKEIARYSMELINRSIKLSGTAVIVLINFIILMTLSLFMNTSKRSMSRPDKI